ncbi:replication initiation and membrane attachment family protein [Thalassobacillus sp. CUG 92003]|uniref:replication initiation and membrane attachment family protein n=1 Tax=Thalassobacillus sp. CUG 92003 TaxID=2736641 RepID=UPI0015E75C11|nr:DnaD domain protein [Thalassobacillus sp. CUG 92003]
MEPFIGKLLPVDGFYIHLNGSVPRDYHQSLTHLYQPLIGVLSMSLYQTLLSDCEGPSNAELQSHHALMNYLSSPLDQIYKSRIKLEAIGLLQTYRSKQDDHTIYLYELQPPFSPKQFFRDDMLALMLHHEIGEDKYRKLQNRFDSNKWEMNAYHNITATFDEVFHDSVTRSANAQSTVEAGAQDTNHSANGPPIESDRLDFDWLTHVLTQRMYPADKILTGDNRRLMHQLASLYNLNSQDLEKAMLWALNDENRLIGQELKEACHDIAQSKPKVKQDTEAPKEASSDNEALSQSNNKEDQFIAMLASISPKELLEDLGGQHASSQDLKMIRDVMTEQGLPTGVMNVLVHYVLLKTDMKLSKAYMEKIASHWSRKNVTTVRQAMNLAKAEHQKYQQWGKQKQSRQQKGKKEVIPDWFEQNQQETYKREKDKTLPFNRQEMAERIRNLTNK